MTKILNIATDKKGDTVIFYITERGHALAKRLKGLYHDSRIEKFKAPTVHELWNKNKYKNFIFIMAAGIVIRTIAPIIKDKKTDPAVIVIDEKGKFVISLLSGHIGGANELAKEIADFLKGEAVITTASDLNNMTSIDLWAKENSLTIENWDALPHIATKLLNRGTLMVYSEVDINLPKEFQKTDSPESADLVITNKQKADSDIKLYLRPKNLVIGIGCNRKTSVDEIEDAVKTTFNKYNLSFLSIHTIATIDIKENEQGLKEFAERHGFKIKTFTADELNSVEGIEKSEAVFNATGSYAVSEPACILASGADKLLVGKQKIGNVTVAIAQMKNSTPKQFDYRSNGKINIVGIGPGSIEHITPSALKAIESSDTIVGYKTYLDLIKSLTVDKEVLSFSMTEEIQRCKIAVERALTGKTVSVISGGDPGIYAMAGLVFETIRQLEKQNGSISIEARVIPGISAFNACASLLGAPLMHDFAVISLSDRLTPWELIERRLNAVAEADFVIVLYNPKSMGRVEYINKAREIFLKYRCPETPVGIVKGAMRKNESVIITNLKDMLSCDIDMETTVIIGNSQTFVWKDKMITPRGYEKKYKN